MIPGFRGGEGIARDFPSSEVLRADGELEAFRGRLVVVVAAEVEVGGHFARVV